MMQVEIHTFWFKWLIMSDLIDAPVWGLHCKHIDVCAQCTRYNLSRQSAISALSTAITESSWITFCAALRYIGPPDRPCSDVSVFCHNRRNQFNEQKENLRQIDFFSELAPQLADFLQDPIHQKSHWTELWHKKCHHCSESVLRITESHAGDSNGPLRSLKESPALRCATRWSESDFLFLGKLPCFVHCWLTNSV